MHSTLTPTSIDVVIPSYNSQSTIEQCLHGLTEAIDRSVSDRLCSDVRIYIVDDGSTDSSPAFIESFINTSNYPITLIKQKQTGPSGARNSGTQAGTAPWVLYMDSDVEPHEHALSTLLNLHHQYPDCLAINGHPQHYISDGDWITQYTNLSLCYQLTQHGSKVNTAFTSLCLMSREGWMAMGGWDTSRTSRYSDDIQSRWHFPPRSIAQCFDGLFIHHKHVRFIGLMKHRFNLGLHFRSSISKDTLFTNSSITLHWRYPVNVICALFSLILIVASLLHPNLWSLNIFWWIPLITVNIPLLRFIRASKEERFTTPFHLISIFGLSYCEGGAMGLGLVYSLCTEPFARRFHDS